MLNIIGLINKGIIEKKKYVKIPYTLTSLKIIKLFYNKGYIFNYEILYNIIQIELNIYENTFVLNNFHFYKSFQLKRHITHKQHKRLFFIKNKKLLLSTSKGLLLSETALKYNIGGCILVDYN